MSAIFKILVSTRYINGDVESLSRKHFFSDWFVRSPVNAVDVTKEINPDAITVTNRLNFKAPDSEYIPGPGIVTWDITYFPGLAIKKDGHVWFRNASSLKKNMKVVDTDFLAYMQSKPGIVVLRSK